MWNAEAQIFFIGCGEILGIQTETVIYFVLLLYLLTKESTRAMAGDDALAWIFTYAGWAFLPDVSI